MGVSLSPRSTGATLLTTFTVMAFLLAAAGLYALLAHAVRRRRRELGIRMALGASSRGVQALVVGRAVRLAGAGLVLVVSWLPARRATDVDPAATLREE